MRMAAIAMLGLGLTLAACDGAKAPATNGAAAATPDPMEAKMLAATDLQRRVAFFRAIYDADFDCKKITDVQSKPRDSDNRLVWLVACDNGADYLITLVPGGTFNVSGVPRPDGPRFPKATATTAPVPPRS